MKDSVKHNKRAQEFLNKCYICKKTFNKDNGYYLFQAIDHKSESYNYIICLNHAKAFLAFLRGDNEDKD